MLQVCVNCEGGLHNTQGASSEEDCDMKNEAEASSAELAPARDAAPGPVDSLKNEVRTWLSLYVPIAVLVILVFLLI